MNIYLLFFIQLNWCIFLGQVWFHSQSLLFHIEVGYCIIPYQQCLSFIEIQAIESMELQNDDATKRLTILMWLWYVSHFILRTFFMHA